MIGVNISSRSSYLLTAENEHWYHDCMDYTNVMEIDNNNIELLECNIDDEHIIIVTKNQCNCNYEQMSDNNYSELNNYIIPLKELRKT
jgi:hypothetical protein